jgi:tetratricopeptide (TPR) repeat protein
MRSIVLGCILGLWVCAGAWGQADEPMALDTAPAATEPAALPEVPVVEPKIEPLQLEASEAATQVAASVPVSQPATQPTELRISGLPARQWLNVDGSIEGHDLEGRLWVVGVVEPWSARSREAAAHLVEVIEVWRPRGVAVLLVTVAPAEEVRRYPGLASLPIPIGTGSPLPQLLRLEPLPRVYLVGPDHTVGWSGPAGEVAEALGRRYEQVAPQGLTKTRENELANRLNRAGAALEIEEGAAQAQEAERYFIASGLAAAVAGAAPANHPLHRQAVELLGRIDQRGEQLLGQAKALLRERKTVEGRDRLRQVAEGFYGRAAGTQALRMLQEMEKDPQVQAAVQAARDEASAQQALLMAQQAMVEQRYADAQRLYGMIGEVYPRTDAAARARQGLTNLRKDKVAATQLAQQKAEPEAPVLLGLAARYAQIGRNEEARRHYQQVLQMAPGTTYAKQAQEGLALLPAVAGDRQQERQ